MEKLVDEMTRKELIELYTNVHGYKLSNLGGGYIPIRTLREAVRQLLEAEAEKDVLAQPSLPERASVEFVSSFDFIDEEEAVAEDDTPGPARSDQWYEQRGLKPPRNLDA